MVSYLRLHDQRAQVNWEGEPPSKLLICWILFHLRVPNILLTLIPVGLGLQILIPFNTTTDSD